ncbi:MAG: HAD hydrolase-like protein, partial [Acidipropionibacterium jensenii]
MAQLEPHHLASVFSEVLSAEDAYHASKRDVVASWLDRTGTPAERIVMVGDTNHDLEIADSLGMRFIHLTSGHQSLEGAGVHHIDSLDELDRALDRGWE